MGRTGLTLTAVAAVGLLANVFVGGAALVLQGQAPALGVAGALCCAALLVRQVWRRRRVRPSGPPPPLRRRAPASLRTSPAPLGRAWAIRVNGELVRLRRDAAAARPASPADLSDEAGAAVLVRTLDSYIEYMRAYARTHDDLAHTQARTYEATGTVQEISSLAFVKPDDTSFRLRRYAERLLELQAHGRYAGETTLKQVLPDGRTVPISLPADTALRRA